MNLPDFNALHTSKDWKKFIYLSENQEKYDCSAPLKVSLTFQQMIVQSVSPAVVCFKGAGDWLRLDFVTSINCEPHVLGDVLTFICTDSERYTIIAQ